MTDAESETLTDALARYSVELPPDQIQQLDAYCRLLWDWNTKFNLTRHTNFDKFVGRDLIDAMELARFLQPAEEVLDVGSGGGVPGVVLAIIRPDLQVSLSESVGKKVQALASIVDTLGLSVGLHPCRAEEVLRDLRFHSLVARAVGPLDRMLRWFEPHWLSMDRLLVVKGPRWTAEKAEAERAGLLRNVTLRCVSEYPMPDADSKSYILEVTRKR